MSIAHITAVIGGIDDEHEVPEQTIKAHKWFFTGKQHPGLSDRQAALYYKQQHHNFLTGYDYYIWTDGKIKITCNDFYQQLIDQLGESEIGIMKHLYRDCIYKEVDHIEHCIKHGNEYLATRYAHRPIREQVNAYKKQGYPRDNGLNDCCIFITRNTPNVRTIFNEWWRVCSEFDHFDQTAIKFICWNEATIIQDIVFRPGSFIDVPHKVLK